MVKESPWDCDDLVMKRGPSKKAGGPQLQTNEGQRVRKSWQGFGIPSSLTNRKGLLTQQLMSENGDERKEAQEGRGGTQNGQIRPLTLRLYTQMGTNLMKGHFDRPTHDKPLQDLNRVSVLIGTQYGLGGKTALWITNEHPTDGNGGNASMVPQGGACRHLDGSSDASIPGNGAGLPDGVGIGQAFGEGGLTLALAAGRPRFPASRFGAGS